MILTIDIGNTNIVVGCIDDEKTYFIERLSTVKTKTELEYAVDIKTVLEIYKIDRKQIRGGIISSVVPQITNIMREAAEKIIRCPVKVVGPGLKTGLNILMDNPAQLGAIWWQMRWQDWRNTRCRSLSLIWGQLLPSLL